MFHAAIVTTALFISVFVAQVGILKSTSCTTYQRYQRFKIFTQYLHTKQRPQRGALYKLTPCRDKTKFKVTHKSIQFYDQKRKTNTILKRPSWWR